MVEYSHEIWIWEFFFYCEKVCDKHYMDQLFLDEKTKHC